MFIFDKIYLGSKEDIIPCILNKNNICIVYSLHKVKTNFAQHVFKLEDKGNVDFTEVFDRLSNQLNKDIAMFGSGSNFIVHCNRGKSRSPASLIYFFMKKYKFNLKDAYSLIIEQTQKHSHTININDGFKKQLMIIENKMFGENSMSFFRRSRKTKYRKRKRKEEFGTNKKRKF